MSAKESVKLILPRSLDKCKSVFKLLKPLNSMGIDGISFSRFQNIPNGTVRRLTISSHPSLIEHYIEKIDKLPDSAFLESQQFPLFQNTIFCPYDRRYSIDYTVRQIEIDFGIKNVISISFYDYIQNKSELFWFYSFDDRAEWLVQQINNLTSLNIFILYFKEQLFDIINTPLLSDGEMQDLYRFKRPIISENHSHLFSTKDEYYTSQYHFGSPFHKPLSQKEFITLKLTFLGKTAKQIAKKLNVSPRTIEKRLKIIQSKTNCKSLKDLRQALFYCSLFMNLVNNYSVDFH